MGEQIGWTGIVIAAVAMVRGEWAAMTARRAARDRLEFDAKLISLEASHKSCTEKSEQLQEAVERHQRQQQESERDRSEMRGRLAVMEQILAARPVPSPGA